MKSHTHPADHTHLVASWVLALVLVHLPVFVGGVDHRKVVVVHVAVVLYWVRSSASVVARWMVTTLLAG